MKWVLEMKHNPRRRSQIVLRLIVGGSLPKSRQQIIDLQRPQGQPAADPVVHAAANRHRKCILRAVCAAGYARSRMRHAKERFGKRFEVVVAAIGKSRTEQIRRKCAIHSTAKNISVVIAAKIRDAAHPISDVIRRGSASAV